MIIVAVDDLKNHKNIHPGLALAGRFLACADPGSLDEGRHEIEGDSVFAIVSECEGKGPHGARLEAHRRYIDVQYCLSGSDLIGYRSLTQCRHAAGDYAEDTDVIFFTDPALEWVSITGGTCAVFFPGDAHAPLGGEGPCKKIVIKIRV